MHRKTKIILPLLFVTLTSACTHTYCPSLRADIKSMETTAADKEHAELRSGIKSSVKSDKNAMPAHVEKNKPMSIVTDGVSLYIDSGSFTSGVAISIHTTDEAHSGAIPDNMENLTIGGAVYRMLPDGQKFDKDITIAMRYDSDALPYGYTADDIYTFFYNEKTNMWQQVERDSVDTRNQIVYSRTNHFTDYINGVMKVPENSDAMAYTPTSIKDLPAADPSDGVTLMAPPTPNNMGTANLTYPLSIPAGRRGMHPHLAITYSSIGCGGFLGLGWALPTSSFEVDNRHGVPLFDSENETETYFFDGDELVTAHTENGMLRYDKPVYRRAWRERDTTVDTVRYYPRVEGSFRRIWRIGHKTSDYRWIVTDRDGTKYFYGYNDESRFRDSKGNIVRWHLTYVEDTYGNRITYSYIQRTFTQAHLNPGKQVLPANINYTGHGDSLGHYNIRFYYASDIKPDAKVSARSGAMEADAYLLDHIDICYDGDIVRTYYFGYKSGVYRRTLLCNIVEADPVTASDNGEQFSGAVQHVKSSIPDVTECGNASLLEQECRYTECDVTGSNDLYADSNTYTNMAELPLFSRNVFDRCCTNTGKARYYTYNEHRFDYSTFTNDLFEPPTFITNKSGTGLEDEIEGDLFIFKGKPGSVEGSSTKTSNFGGGIDVGFGYNTFLKSLTVGGNYMHTTNSTEGLITLVDLDSDGFPDKLYKRNGIMCYRLRKNDDPLHFGAEQIVLGNKDFLAASASNRVFGVEGALGLDNGFKFSVGWTSHTSATDTYLADFDGDGRPDIFQKGKLLYNRIDKYPFCPFIPPHADAIYDTIWNCGVITVDTIPLGELVDQTIFEDYENDTVVYTVCRDSVYYVGIDVPVDTVVCHDTMVVVSYQAPHPYKPDLENVRMWVAPYDGTVRITGVADFAPRTFNVGDGVDVMIQRDTSVILSTHLAFNNVPANINTDTFHVSQGSRLFFRVLSGDDRNSDRILWNPTISYTRLSDANINIADSIGPDGLNKYSFNYGRDFLLGGVQDVIMPYRGRVRLTAEMNTASGGPFLYPVTMQIIINDAIRDTFSVIQCGQSAFFTRTFTAEKNSKIRIRLVSSGDANWSAVDAQCRLTILENLSSDPTDSQFECIDTRSIPGDTIFFYDYYPQIQPLVRKQTETILGQSVIVYDENYYNTLGDSYAKFGTMYRNWGQFAYKSQGIAPLDTSLLMLPPIFGYTQADSTMYTDIGNDTPVVISEDSPEASLTIGNLPAYSPLESTFVIMQADFKHKCWSAYSDYTYTERNLISNLPHPPDGYTVAQGDSAYYASTSVCYAPESINASKKTESNSKSFAATGKLKLGNHTLLDLGGSYTISDSRQISDMMDLNGDGLPDAISETIVQYTQPQGGLSLKKSHHSIDHIYLDTSCDITIGGSFFGGSIISKPEPAINTLRAHHSLSGNVGADISGTTTKSDGFVSWADINGDGLPDKIVNSGNSLYYYQNTGYGFMGRRLFHDGDLTRQGYGSGISGGLNMVGEFDHSWLSESGLAIIRQLDSLGIIPSDSLLNNQHATDSLMSLLMSEADQTKYRNKLSVSISAGMNATVSRDNTILSYQDLNGDGLTDKVEKYKHGYVISFNSGKDFDAGIAVLHFGEEFDSKTYNTDLSGAITVGVSIAGLPIKIEGNPKGGLLRSLSSTKGQWIDMDGDGVLDYVWDEGDGMIGMRRSRLGNANRLVGVTLPTKGTYDIEYSLNHDGPRSQGRHWVMSSLTVNDNLASAIPMKSEFLYQDRNTDHKNRDDYGYSEVVTLQYDSPLSTIPYRRSVRHYLNDNYLYRGLCDTVKYQDGDGSDTYSIEVRRYNLMDILTGQSYSHNDPACVSDGWPAVEVEESLLFNPGNTAPSVTTYKEYQYGPHGNLVEVYHDGDENDPSDNYTLTIYYDSIGDYIVSADTSETVSGYGIYRQRSAEYNSHGDISKLTLQNASGNAVHDYSYDIYGNLVIETFPSDVNSQRFAIRHRYDSVIHSLPVETWNSYGLHSFAIYNYALQRPLRTISAQGGITTYSYDSRGNLRRINAPLDPDTTSPTIMYARYYDQRHSRAEWNQEPMWAESKNKNTGVNYIMNRIETDGLGRPNKSVKLMSIDGQDGFVNSGRIVYDGLGRTITIYQPSYSLSGTTYNIDTFATRTSYDLLDRVTRIRFPDGTVQTNDYSYIYDPDGFIRLHIKTIDANNHISSLFRNTNNLTTAFIDPLGAATRWKYDAAGQTLQTINPEDSPTFYTYDSLGRCTMRIHPASGKTQWRYDAAGNLIRQLFNSGDYIEYMYDYMRPIGISHSACPWNDVWYSYGTSSGGVQAGRLEYQQDATGVQWFHYDLMGNVDTNRHTYVFPNTNNTLTLSTVWEYDSWGRVRSIIYPDKETVVYNYDSGGLLYSIDGNKPGNTGHSTYIDRIHYNFLGQRISMRDGGDVETTYKYDPATNRLLAMSDYFANTQETLQDNEYTYDNVGNITKILDNGRNPRSQMYTYNGANRLVESTGEIFEQTSNYSFAYSANYSYSPAGKLLYKFVAGERLSTSSGVQTMGYENVYMYDEPNNPFAISAVRDTYGSDYDFSWDPNGNLTKSVFTLTNTERKLCWTEDNRLQAFIEFNIDEMKAAYYNYSATGERNLKITSPYLNIQQNAVSLQNPALLYSTLYASPLLTLTRYGYTKHYFDEGRRVCSKIGGGFRYVDINTFDNNLPEISLSYDDQYAQQNTGVMISFYENFDVDVDLMDDIDLHDVLVGNEATRDETEPAFYYHTDHLGSSAYLTDEYGNVTQTLNYMPYGEDWIERNFFQAQDTTRLGIYRFNGKEKDCESGFHYYGARYYWSDVLTGWLSVDPMADKYPSLSPYNYCAWNPVKLVDPDGREIMEDWYRNTETGAVIWREGHAQEIVDDGGDTYSNIGESYSFLSVSGNYINCFQNCIVSIGEKQNVTNDAYYNDEVRADLIRNDSPLPVSHKKELFANNITRRGMHMPDMIGLNFGGSAVVGGGYTMDISIGYIRQSGFFYNIALGAGIGFDLSVNVGVSIGHYFGVGNPQVESVKGLGFASSMSIGRFYIQNCVSRERSQRWNVTSLGLSKGLTKVRVNGASGVSFSF